ncbi:hypothetical protein F4677DRAFT_426401 [Hypoxylon crocopeplum]|nr:hypothetical protein F4677DRAFT_426401 [Hypoxylon crocopeplum]
MENSRHFSSSSAAARGYLPLGGHRAIPLRMPNSLRRLSDRPGSVPAHLDRRISSENHGSSPYPPRPATSSEVGNINQLIPHRHLPFPQRRASQITRNNSLFQRPITPGVAIQPRPTNTVPRAVAKRGSKRPPSDSALIPFEQEPTISARGQERATERAAMGSDSSKRVKFNVKGYLSWTSAEPKASYKAPLKADPYLHATEVDGADHEEAKIAIEEGINGNLEKPDDSTNVTGSSHRENEIPGSEFKSRTQRQVGTARADIPYSYATPGKVGLIGSPQRARNLAETREIANIRKADVPDGIIGSYTAKLQELDVNRQISLISHRKYATASTQYDVLPEPVSSPTQRGSPGKASAYTHQPAPDVGNITGVEDVTVRKVDGEDRLVRIKEMLDLQEEIGMDGFIRARLRTGGPNLLETLANEILLGMVARDDELLKHAIKYMS